MYWYKVKSALIILFLAINIFLLARVGIVAYNENKQEQENLDKIVSILQGDNIKIDKEIIPTGKVNLNSLSVENIFSDESTFASAILGNGILITDQENHTYTSGAKALTISDNRFYYHNSAAGTNVTPNSDNAEKIKVWLSEIGLYTDETYYTLDATRIEYHLAPGGHPFYDAGITVIPGERGIISMSGNWVTPTIDHNTTYQLGPVSDALIAFYRDPDRPKKCEITSIRAGYGVWLDDYTLAYKTAEAIPVWRIRLADGACFYYDAR